MARLLFSKTTFIHFEGSRKLTCNHIDFTLSSNMFEISNALLFFYENIPYLYVCIASHRVTQKNTVYVFSFLCKHNDGQFLFCREFISTLSSARKVAHRWMRKFFFLIIPTNSRFCAKSLVLLILETSRAIWGDGSFLSLWTQASEIELRSLHLVLLTLTTSRIHIYSLFFAPFFERSLRAGKSNNVRTKQQTKKKSKGPGISKTSKKKERIRIREQ